MLQSTDEELFERVRVRVYRRLASVHRFARVTQVHVEKGIGEPRYLVVRWRPANCGGVVASTDCLLDRLYRKMRQEGADNTFDALAADLIDKFARCEVGTDPL